MLGKTLSSDLDEHGREASVRLQLQHHQRGCHILLLKNDDVGLDSIQQGEVSFKQRASLWDRIRADGEAESVLNLPFSHLPKWVLSLPPNNFT